MTEEKDEILTPYIKLGYCKHGVTYKISSRNLRVGVFNSKVSGFIGIRTKFGDEYLFTEFHYETGAPFGTVHPEKEIEPCPIPDISEDLGSMCETCGKDVTFIKNSPESFEGCWKHVDPEASPCKEHSYGVRSCRRSNTDLFEYLKKIESSIPNEWHPFKGLWKDRLRKNL